jgi:hypothetical protein
MNIEVFLRILKKPKNNLNSNVNWHRVPLPISNTSYRDIRIGSGREKNPKRFLM